MRLYGKIEYRQDKNNFFPWHTYPSRGISPENLRRQIYCWWLPCLCFVFSALFVNFLMMSFGWQNSGRTVKEFTKILFLWFFFSIYGASSKAFNPEHSRLSQRLSGLLWKSFFANICRANFIWEVILLVSTKANLIDMQECRTQHVVLFFSLISRNSFQSLKLLV